MKLEFVSDYNGILKEYLNTLNLSKRFLKRVKLYGTMMINNNVCKNYYEIKKGDLITLEYNEDTNDDLVSKDFNLDIIYEDNHVLIINKPFNISSQPSHKHFEDNIVSYVKSYFNKNSINSNVHVVTRLDFSTSGLMIIAKDGLTHFKLTNEKIIKKKYKAIIEGTLDEKEGVINLPIRREQVGSIKRIVSSDGKEAITEYKVIKENKNRSLVDINLITGRTHQIRVHFSYLNHPLVGDKLYGHDDKRLYLHCYYLEYVDPFTNKLICIENDANFDNIID